MYNEYYKLESFQIETEIKIMRSGFKILHEIKLKSNSLPNYFTIHSIPSDAMSATQNE